MYIKLQLQNPDDIHITHAIRFDDTPTAYDILVEDEQSYSPDLMPFLASKVVTED
jgi:SWI/SNF-related matrix-associated actin-dependent regulator of chromatin subfamily D